jgi:hypothetical protein
MRRVLIAAAAASLTVTWPSACPAEGDALDDTVQISREEWQGQVKASRERLDTMRREHKRFAPLAPTAEELTEAASRRILKDESLMPGDVVSTNQGLFRFIGPRDGERRPEDFVRIR